MAGIYNAALAFRHNCKIADFGDNITNARFTCDGDRLVSPLIDASITRTTLPAYMNESERSEAAVKVIVLAVLSIRMDFDFCRAVFQKMYCEGDHHCAFTEVLLYSAFTVFLTFRWRGSHFGVLVHTVL